MLTVTTSRSNTDGQPGKPKRMRELAEELVQFKVDVILAPSSIYTAAAKQASTTIPIVFVSHADPLGTGHVKSLARPGGNITGLSLMMTETNVKGLELFKEAVPALTRLAVFYDPATPSHTPGLRAIEAAGPALGLHIQAVPVGAATEYESAPPLRKLAGIALTGFWCYLRLCSLRGLRHLRTCRCGISCHRYLDPVTTCWPAA